MSGWACARLGDFEKGLELTQTALRWAEAQGNRTREANSCLHLALLFAAWGFWEDAIKFSNRGLPIARAAGDHFTVGTLLSPRGYATFMAGDNKRGIESQRESLGVIQATGSDKMLALHSALLAKCLALNGAREEAIELATRAQAYEQQRGARPIALLARAMATVGTAAESGWSEAELVFAQALAECEAHSVRPLAAEVHFYRARALWNVDRTRAQSDLEMASTAFREMGMRWWLQQANQLATH